MEPRAASHRQGLWQHDKEWEFDKSQVEEANVNSSDLACFGLDHKLNRILDAKIRWLDAKNTLNEHRTREKVLISVAQNSVNEVFFILILTALPKHQTNRTFEKLERDRELEKRE